MKKLIALTALTILAVQVGPAQARAAWQNTHGGKVPANVVVSPDGDEDPQQILFVDTPL